MSRPELAADARILWRLLRGQSRGGSHASHLEDFYTPQADRYDAFRARLLHGRGDLIEAMEIPGGARVVELGCGTGSNLEVIAQCHPVTSLTSVELVDLCPPLLALARRRAAEYANVVVIKADASQWQPAQAVDRVILSYALTMMPDWRAVLANAHAMLAPGGRLGVVDFHLPAAGSDFACGRFAERLQNRFWRAWFAHDGVHLSDLHLPTLRSQFIASHARESLGSVPYLPGLRTPYYLFVGTKSPCTGTRTG
jgi:S-adenosylmethionine-diacylgycerolhomoserine-N-methlytransferase